MYARYICRPSSFWVSPYTSEKEVLISLTVAGTVDAVCRHEWVWQAATSPCWLQDSQRDALLSFFRTKRL